MLYLASQSPRRQSILKDLGVNFTLLLPTDQEDAEALEVALPEENSKDYVLRVTLLKLSAAVNRLKNQGLNWAPIVCADTTVAIHQHHVDSILGKPKDDDEALAMLTQLNNQCHEVHTAVAIQISPDAPPDFFVVTSQVYFANNSQAKLMAYVATHEPLGKAGAYAIQGLGSTLIKKIEGSHSAIMGLPIYETSLLLEKAEISYILYP
jgi:septum formation protein